MSKQVSGSVRVLYRLALKEAVVRFVRPSLLTGGAGRTRRLALTLVAVFLATTMLAVPGRVFARTSLPADSSALSTRVGGGCSERRKVARTWELVGAPAWAR